MADKIKVFVSVSEFLASIDALPFEDSVKEIVKAKVWESKKSFAEAIQLLASIDALPFEDSVKEIVKAKVWENGRVFTEVTQLLEWIHTLPIEDDSIREAIKAYVEAVVKFREAELGNVVQGVKANARIEPRTGLLTLEAFRGDVVKYLKRDARGHFVMFAFIDIADFKEVNTRFGHAGGDAAIEAIGVVLSRIRSSSGFAARFAGDEFLLFGEVRDLKEASAVGHRIYREAKEIRVPEHPTMRLSLDIGIIGVWIPPLTDRFLLVPDAETAEKRMEAHPDSLLYEVKYFAKTKKDSIPKDHVAVKPVKFEQLLEPTKKEKEEKKKLEESQKKN